SLSWTDLQDQLDKTILDIESLQQVLGHVRRCGALICGRHNARRQSRRDDLLRDMETFVGARLGVEAARLVEAEAMLLRQIENGYQGILDRLAHSDTAPLDPSARVSGLFWHIVDGYRELHSMYERQ